MSSTSPASRSREVSGRPSVHGNDRTDIQENRWFEDFTRSGPIETIDPMFHVDTTEHELFLIESGKARA